MIFSLQYLCYATYRWYWLAMGWGGSWSPELGTPAEDFPGDLRLEQALGLQDE
jgi:hypothetical protein